ncbi:MAG: TolC family outer membrane protein [Alphaproteobacteria bacterium]|nr:TolC family outer membrane protein [Alphaproteobacteria bacterium]
MRIFPVAAIFLVLIQPVAAETLRDALTLAYETNPTIRAERARLGAVREGKNQAWAGALPQISATGSYSYVDSSQELNFGGGATPVDVTLNTVTAGINAEQALFTGFGNYNAIKQAEARIRAGGAQLAATEQAVLREVAAAYFSVERNMAVYELNKKNVDVLLRQNEMATVRFEVGEITRTDVAQADARLAGARANLSQAHGNLAIARATYTQLVGQMPGDLEAVEDLPELPDTLDTAKTLAFEYAPAVIVAREQSEASRRQIKVARSAIMPRVSAVASYQYADEPSSFVIRDEQFSYGLRATMPLFLGGANYSRIREAKALHASDRSRIIEAERQVEAATIVAWERLLASRAIIISARAAVDANALALEGVTQEALAGTRTTLDVLDAEQEFLNSQVAHASATRDAQSAAYTLLAAIGLLTTEAIGIADAGESGSALQLYRH